MKLAGVITPICWSYTMWSIMFFTIVLLSGGKPLLYYQIGWLLGISVGVVGIWIAINDTFIRKVANDADLSPRLTRILFVWSHLAWLLFCLAKTPRFSENTSPILILAGSLIFFNVYLIIVGLPTILHIYKGVSFIPFIFLLFSFQSFLLYLVS